MRIALGLQYNGCQYHGWQSQPQLTTVQEQVQTALAKIANEDVELICAGRTDTGVHATGQVVHFDTEVTRPEKAWIFGTNTHLPKDIAVHWAAVVSEDFHARFSATARRYRYFIYNHHARPASLVDQLTWYYMRLDDRLMHEAAQHLVGEHDFSAYRSVGCQSKTPNRCIQSLTVTRKQRVITIDIKANAFLQHMVRNIVGVLFAVGSGREESNWSKEVLESRDRRLGGVTAPPYGLYLADVEYPSHFNIQHGVLPQFIL